MSEEQKPVDVGGPAFPMNWEKKGEFWAFGLTARDYFAAKAMQSLVALDHMTDPDVAKYAYEMADAMLKARAQ